MAAAAIRERAAAKPRPRPRRPRPATCRRLVIHRPACLSEWCGPKFSRPGEARIKRAAAA